MDFFSINKENLFDEFDDGVVLRLENLFFRKDKLSDVEEICRKRNIKIFANLLIFFIEFFTGAIPFTYLRCCRDEKMFFKWLIVKKFKLEENKEYFPSLRIDSNVVFSFEDILEISKFQSQIKKNEMYNYLIKKFLIFENEIGLKNKLYGQKKVNLKRNLQKNETFSSFRSDKMTMGIGRKREHEVFINSIESTKNSKIDKSKSKRKKSQVTFNKFQSFIKSKSELFQKFKGFLKNGKDSQAVECCNEVTLKKCIDFFEKMEINFFLNRRFDKATFLKREKIRLDSTKTKFPVHTVDVQYHSSILLIQLE